MKKNIKIGLIIIGAILLFILLIALWFAGAYNSLVTLSAGVDNSWAQVQNQYQRRADLVPNLVSTVQGAASFEKNTQTEITALRTQALAAKTAWDNAQTVDQKIAAAQQVDASVATFRALNINVENYPQLKATENFETLQAQLEGTENRVAVERQRYNDAVKEYDVRIKSIPTVFVANMFGFKEKTYFQAEAGAAEAPVVSFPQ